MTDTIETLRTELAARKGAFGEIARVSGLSYSWVCKFAAGARRNPTITSIELLASALALVPPTRGADDDGAEAREVA